ncbi:CaiB/BaiF CoA transferase family protein [Microbacterium sp. RD1]|uniref:CaiB/BaiF CoA transferase family protein n=1 Tax=Microbacterium sp. RD1 TaxID=3457313 RepID=UPI003FA5447A
MNAPTTSSLPLAGIRIVSVAEQFPGPYATLILGDLGAEVIQVERPGYGDPSRAFENLYAALNRGKRSIVLDLKDPEQSQTFRDLIAQSDALIEGFRPGVMDRLGFGAQDMAAANPRLVYVSISGFGQDGPYRDRPAHDLTLQGLAGLIPRDGDATPTVPQLTLADVSAGTFGALAVLAGLASRSGTGRGGRWDVSMFDSLLSLGTVPLALGAAGLDAGGLGEDPGYGCYRASDDRWLAMSIAFEDHFWHALCGVLELPDLAGVGSGERLRRREEIRATVGSVIATAPAGHWDARFAAAGIPCGIVQSMPEVARDPHVAARDVLTPLDDGSLVVRQPLVVDGQRLGPRRGVPRLGEHTDEVLAEIVARRMSGQDAPPTP